MIMPVMGGIPRHALCQVDDGHSKYHDGIRFEVEIRCLDEIADLKKSMNVKAIKIDVENFEHAVLTGGLELIRRCRPIIFCELSDDKARVMDLLETLGYSMMGYSHGSLHPVEKARAVGGNYFFIPQESSHA